MKKSDDSIIILAAGVGSRFQSSVPKVFHKIGGLSLLDHVIKAAKEINPVEIVAVFNPLHKNMDLTFVADIKKAYQNVPTGTASAVECGMELLSDDFNGWVYVLYGDIPLISSEMLLKLSAISKTCDRTAVVILAMNSSETNNLGKLGIDEHGIVKNIIEAKDASHSSNVIPLCNAGLFIKKSLLKEFIKKIRPSQATDEFYITEIVRLAYEAGYVCRYHEGNSKELLGVNTRSELALLEKIFQEKEREKHLSNGVTLIAPETVFFSYDTYIEKDAIVYPYVVFLKNVIVKSGAQIGPFCVIEGSIIKNAQVGPFTRLRTGADIQNGAKVGNFVEIKNSVISENSKVNHLSYIGDADIGKNTNIGAGTITCNYDGFKKHKTVVGENVFVGSNTALGAPVKIHNNAIVGAGSVVIRDVMADALAIARSDQENIENGAINFRKVKKCAES